MNASVAEIFSQSISTLLSIGDIGTRKDLYLNVMLYDAKMERSTLSAPNASIALMFVPAVFEIHDSSFQSVIIRRYCQCCGVCSDRSPSCRGLPQRRMHYTRTLHVQESYTRPYLGESCRCRTRARDRAWSKGVGGQLCPQSC